MKKQLFLLIGIISSISLQGQELNLETCLKMADTANLSIRNSLLDIEINDNNSGKVSADDSTKLKERTKNGCKR